MMDEAPSRDCKLFLTKQWGFQPEKYPTTGFTVAGARENFLRAAGRDDWIVIAGTKGPPTLQEEQGRLLGMCLLGHEDIDADAILKEIGTELSPREIDEDGFYRWRYAMPILHARRFLKQPELPDLEDIFGSYLPGLEWATYAIDLSERFGPEAIERIRDLPSNPCAIADIPALESERIFGEHLGRKKRGGNTGPPPSTVRRGSQREAGTGVAYLLKLKGRPDPFFKIGYTHDFLERLATLNKEIRPGVTGCEWEQVKTETFEKETYAHRFEQAVLQRLGDKLVEGENEIVRASQKEIDKVWIEALMDKEWID